MQIESVADVGGSVEVTATGVHWAFARHGAVTIRARLAEREVATVRLGGSGAWRVARRDADVRVVRDGCAVTLRPDGVLVIDGAPPPFDLALDLAFEPEYTRRRRGNALYLDERGGLGVHRAAGASWIAAYPPRPPDPERQRQSIAHEGRPSPFPDGAYPDASIVSAAARNCDVFALHAYFWEGLPPAERPRFGPYARRRCAWRSRQHVPHDPARLAVLRDEVRAAGMRLVVYVSPFHMQAPDPLEEMRRIVTEHDVDGLYLDGVAGDLPTYDAIVRGTRALLGPDRILYVNASDQPFRDPGLTCPSVDAWADFVVRGDAGRGGLARERFLRWAVSGRNLSNAVGMWCWYRSSGRLLQREIPPPAADLHAALRHGVRLWRRSAAWRESGGDVDAFDRTYYPALADALAALQV